MPVDGLFGRERRGGRGGLLGAFTVANRCSYHVFHRYILCLNSLQILNPHRQGIQKMLTDPPESVSD